MWKCNVNWSWGFLGMVSCSLFLWNVGDQWPPTRVHGVITSRSQYEIHHHEHLQSVTLSGCFCAHEVSGSLREEQKLKTCKIQELRKNSVLKRHNPNGGAKNYVYEFYP